MELEGIVSKLITSRYISGRSKAWRKTKAFVEGEFVVIGHKRDKDRPVALLARETEAGLKYAGSAWVTLSREDGERFWRSVQRLETNEPAAAVKLQRAFWIRPELLVRAKHLRCSGELRHATLRALMS